MKNGEIIEICIILILLVINIGCFDNEDKSTFDKEYELVSAWEGLTPEDDPVSTLDTFKEINFSETDYQKILSSDDNSKFTQNSGSDDGYPFNLYQFNYDGQINSIQITWEGYGSTFISDEESKVDLYLYRPKDSEWSHIFYRQWFDDENDYIFQHSDLTLISQYIDEQNNIYILIRGPYGAGDSTGTLSTDFIELKGI